MGLPEFNKQQDNIMNNKKLNKKLLVCSFICLFVFGLTQQGLAAGLIPEDTSDLNSFIQLALNVSQFILGIVGSLTLLMFVVGGVQFMISAGSSESISKAKKTITAAVVGLLIVFSSWLIINFVVQSLGLNPTKGSVWNWSVIK